MTDAEINTAVAEAIGWTRIHTRKELMRLACRAAGVEVEG